MAEIFHGGGLDAARAQYGGSLADWLDLSTGINPSPYPLPKLDSSLYHRLPDKGLEGVLLEAAHHYYDVPEGMEVIASSGTQALLQILPTLLGAAGVEIASPTYGEHANAWAKAGADVNEISSFSEEQMPNHAAVVVNPNNPTTQVRTGRELAELAGRRQWLVVDEAFCDPNPQQSILQHVRDHNNIVVLKSFGKFFGLAGLRLGFAVCNAELARDIRSRLGPWAVSGPALSIANTALRDTDWITSTRQELHDKSEAQAAVLETAGLKVEGKNPLFIYTKSHASEIIRKGLARQNILVRHFPEQSGFLRFGLCSGEAELQRLSEALNNV